MAFMMDFESFFKTIDKNNDGYLSLEEVKKCMQAKGYKGPESDIIFKFMSVDTSGDNKISLQEFKEAFGKAPSDFHKAANMRMVFQRFDKDGNNIIDRNELGEVFRELGKTYPEAEIQKMIDIADKDKSGTIDYEEFIDAFKGQFQ